MNNISILIVVTLLLILTFFNTMSINSINRTNKAQTETLQELIEIAGSHTESISILATMK